MYDFMTAQNNAQNKTQRKKARTPRKITARYLENAGLYYLERYATSAENFRRVMMRKVLRSCQFHEQDPDEFAPMVDDLVQRYTQAGLLNDEVYARAQTEKLRRRGASKRAIHAKLHEKGLTSEQVDAALCKADDEHEDAEFNAACAYARRRRIGPYRNPPDAERYQKDLGALARAGFSYDIARNVLGAPDTDEQSST